MDNKVFFDVVRNPLFRGALKPQQVNGCLIILDAMRQAKWPLAWAAYGLATAYHETAHTMQPIKEKGGDDYFRKMYDVQGDRPALARAHGNTAPGDGVRYCGRGYVQITWKDNYRKASRIVGLDLITNPDLAMRPNVAIAIMIDGMEAGWFTGKKNADFLNGTNPNYYAARRIINGQDKAATISTYAGHFEAALKAAGYAPATDAPAAVVAPAPLSVVDAVPPRPAPPSPAPAPSPPARKLSLWQRILGARA